MDKFEEHEHNGMDSKRIKGKNLLNAPQPAITVPTGGATVDAQSRTAITSIITTLQELGFIK